MIWPGGLDHRQNAGLDRLGQLEPGGHNRAAAFGSNTPSSHFSKASEISAGFLSESQLILWGRIMDRLALID
jgi:hypothetical protein